MQFFTSDLILPLLNDYKEHVTAYGKMRCVSLADKHFIIICPVSTCCHLNAFYCIKETTEKLYLFGICTIPFLFCLNSFNYFIYCAILFLVHFIQIAVIIIFILSVY